MSQWRWRLVKVLFAGLLLTTAAGASEVPALGFGDVQFSFGQVVTLLMVGIAWGDMRANVKDTKERVTRIEKRLDDED